MSKLVYIVVADDNENDVRGMFDERDLANEFVEESRDRLRIKKQALNPNERELRQRVDAANKLDKGFNLVLAMDKEVYSRGFYNWLAAHPRGTIRGQQEQEDTIWFLRDVLKTRAATQVANLCREAAEIRNRWASRCYRCSDEFDYPAFPKSQTHLLDTKYNEIRDDLLNDLDTYKWRTSKYL